MTPVTEALVERVRRRLAADAAAPSAENVARALRAEPGVLGPDTVLAVVDQVRRDTGGAGVLEPLLEMPGVTDVLVNGPHAVHVDRGDGLEQVDVRFADEAEVRRLAQRLAALAGRRLDDASPWVDARLPDGTRLHAVLAPIAQPGTVVSLRVPSRRCLSLDDLVAAGSLTADGADVLRGVMASRAAFVVSGGTGSGKTTLLAALLAEAPGHERLVVVEDAAELRPQHPHVVALEARPANVEGRGPSTCATSSVRRCGCVPTGSSWARCAGRRSSISWRPSTRGTRVAAARSTPTPRSTSRHGSRPSRSRPACRARRSTPSSPRVWTWWSTCGATTVGAASSITWGS